MLSNMTQEDKELLLKDLCGRQMYNVKCQVFDDTNPYTLSGVLHNKSYSQLYFGELDWKENDGFVSVEYCKPYLFPLSSMTEEQREELYKMGWYLDGDKIYSCFRNYDDANYKTHTDCFELINWCHKNHLDCRGLIEKGLAIDATNLNIY